jgi:hypothetical protein
VNELVRDLGCGIGSGRAAFAVEVWGAPRADGRWEGWLRFTSPDGLEALTTDVETVQSHRAGLAYWAGGLRPAYLEGALARARRRAAADAGLARAHPRGSEAVSPGSDAVPAVPAEPGVAPADTPAPDVDLAVAPADEVLGRPWAPAPGWIDGIVASVVVAAVALQTSRGDTVTVDLRHLDPATRAALRPGDLIAVRGRRSRSGRLVATTLRRAA